MTNSFTSPIEDLNAAIQNHNPFTDLKTAVTVQDIWSHEFLDVSTLNAHVDHTVFQALQQLGFSEEKVTSIAIADRQGSGKTHLLSRIRRRLPNEGNALFIYASASHFTDLDLIASQFLRALSDSLSQIGHQNIQQWQEIAIELLIESYTYVNKFEQAEMISKHPKNLIGEQFTYIQNKNNKFIDKLTIVVLNNKPNSDPDIIRAILWTLSEAHALDAVKWLSGDELSESKAEELGLANPDQKHRQSKAFDEILQIVNLLSEYRPLLICFDDLEEVPIPNAAFTKAQVVAGLVNNLFDNLNLANSSCGVVILTVMQKDTWELQIKPLSQGIPERFSTVTNEPIDLKSVDSNSIVELVTLWLKTFYKPINLEPHDPLYPFTESQLKDLAEQKPTVKEILNWCANHFVIPTQNEDSQQQLQPHHPVEPAFSNELAALEDSLETFLEDKSTLAATLLLGFSTVIGETIEGVTIERLEKVEPQSINKGYIDFKIIGTENDTIVKIGVAVIQQDSANSVLAGLKRLIEYKKFDLTRGCLVRSKDIAPNAPQLQECLNKLLSPQLGGKWVSLTTAGIKPLLAILFVSRNREKYELSREQITDFIHQTHLVSDNPLIREILSAASS